MIDLSRFQTKPRKVIVHGKVETVPSTAQPKRRKHLFAQVSLHQAAAAAKATRCHQLFVWIWLQHMAWKTRSQTFTVTNAALTQYGIDRRRKWQALKSLEAAGLILIVRYKSKAPTVTLIER